MKGHQRSIIKAIIFLSFIIIAISVVRFTSVKEFFKEETLSYFLKELGYWAPLIFVIVYAVGVCLFVPGTLLTALGAAIFGAFWGFLYVWAGAMVGASAAFWIGRTLGRESVAFMIGDRLRQYDDAIERKWFAAVFYLRMIYFPFTLMNFGMGLTKVRFWDYFLAGGPGLQRRGADPLSSASRGSRTAAGAGHRRRRQGDAGALMAEFRMPSLEAAWNLFMM